MEEGINKVNLNAYSEKGRFLKDITVRELDLYRQQNLDRHTPHTYFLQLILPNNQFSVIDIGSGYSAFLYSLSLQNMLASGIAVESSLASYLFAEQWKKDWGLTKIKNINSDALKIEYGNESTDLFTILDSTFPLLYHENKNYPELLLKKAYNSLKNGGTIIIEIINFSNLVKKGKVNFWKMFSDTDTFKYGLYEEEYNKETNLINRRSIYINRYDNSISEKIELVYYYTLESLKQLLVNAGFTIYLVFDGFNLTPFIESTSERLILVGTK
jgi:SAM-dependent methyltransferase